MTAAPSHETRMAHKLGPVTQFPDPHATCVCGLSFYAATTHAVTKAHAAHMSEEQTRIEREAAHECTPRRLPTIRQDLAAIVDRKKATR